MSNPAQERKTHNLFLDSMNDGWQNLMTRAGVTGQDKRVSTSFAAQAILSHTELSSVYRGDGIGKKIIDIPVSDMLRKWFSIEGDSENQVTKALDKIGTRQAFKAAKKWARLYGGSLIVIGIDDGSKGRGDKALEEPLREDNIKELSFYRVYTEEQVTWETTDLDNDASSANYGKPKLYTIHPVLENTSAPYKVHHSRTLKFIGEPLPERESAHMRYWGDSNLQSVYTRLRGFANSLIATESILDEFVIGILTIENLQDLIAAGKEDLITRRLQQIDMSKHILNTMLVDKEEDFRRIDAKVNGIKDILSFFKDVLSAASGIPQIKLFGEQSKGLGSQAAGNIRMYYDDIADKQEDELRLPLERIVTLLIASKAFKAEIPDTWHLKFNQLWEMSAKEEAEGRELIAKADERYVKAGVLTAQEVANSRFGGETYSSDTILSEEGIALRKKTAEVAIDLNKSGGFGEEGEDEPKEPKEPEETF